MILYSIYSVLHALHPPLKQNIKEVWKKPSHRHMPVNITQVDEYPGLCSDTDFIKKSASQGMFFYRIPYFLFGENIYANRKLTWY